MSQKCEDYSDRATETNGDGNGTRVQVVCFLVKYARINTYDVVVFVVTVLCIRPCTVALRARNICLVIRDSALGRYLVPVC